MPYASLKKPPLAKNNEVAIATLDGMAQVGLGRWEDDKKAFILSSSQHSAGQQTQQSGISGHWLKDILGAFKPKKTKTAMKNE